MGALAYLMGKKLANGYGSGSTANGIAHDFKENIENKVVIVTGCNAGIGKETVRALSNEGAKVIMACRNLGKAEKARDEIKSTNPKADLLPMLLDISSFESIRTFVDDFHKLNLPLNVLINNAGVMACDFKLTKDGHEMQFGTNHLGHFLLTELLLEDLKKHPKARIVVVSSVAHTGSYEEGIRFGLLNDKDAYNRFKAYGQSKLANLLQVKELNERCVAKGLDITVNALHPGVIASELQRHLSLLGPLWNTLGRPFHKNQQQGAATSVYLACANDLKGGDYYEDCNNMSDAVIPSANDSKLWTKLRTESMKLTKLN